MWWQARPDDCEARPRDNNNNKKRKKKNNNNNVTKEKSQTTGNVEKVYEALLCGHLNPIIETGKIDLPLQRDHRFPPFVSFFCFVFLIKTILLYILYIPHLITDEGCDTYK